MEDYSKIYFGAQPAHLAAGELLDRARSFYVTLEANAYLIKIQRMWSAYHGIYTSNYGFNHHTIQFVGEQGELAFIPVNHFRNLAQHILVLVTADRPTLQARAINTDYKSLSQTFLANAVLDYYMRQKGLEENIRRAVEYAVVLGSGFIKVEWNATAGQLFDYDEESEQFNYEGDLEFTNLSPFDVVVDGSKEYYNDEWVLTRTFKNKYDIIAKYPEYADKIRGLKTKDFGDTYRIRMFSNDVTDDIPVYEFYHKPTEVLPEGRYILFLDTDLILLDTKLPYRRVPVFRIVPSEILGTPYGYSPMYDVYPIQEAINSLYSTILTNQNAFGVQNIYIPRGADINVSSLPGGLNILEANAPPQALQLTQTPKEVFDYLQLLIQAAETLTGINSVVRGNPEANLRTGNALALVQSNALQFLSGLQNSYIKLLENVGTGVIEILKDFAQTPRMIELVGKNNRPYLKEFQGGDISEVSRVVVDVGNALASTTAGRLEMATNLSQMGLLDNAKDYLTVLNTGNLDVAYESEMNELLLIKAENEKLLSGTNPIVSPMDRHSLHIEEHRAVISDPELRMNPQLVQTVMAHVQGHMDALRNTDPALLQLVGEQPLPPIQPPMPPGMPGMAPPPGMGAPGPSNTPALMAGPVAGQVHNGKHPVGPNGQGVPQPKLPKPPKPFSNAPVTAAQKGIHS